MAETSLSTSGRSGGPGDSLASDGVVALSAKPKTELSNFQFALVVTIPVLIFLVVVVAYPLGYAFYLSFVETKFFGGFSVKFVGLANYIKVVFDAGFWTALWVTLRFTVCTVVLSLIVGMGLALILRDLPPRWKWMRALIILPWAVSPYGAGIFFAYLGRGQNGLGSSIANALGVEADMNLISSKTVIEYLAVGAAWNMAPLVAFFLMANMLTTPRRLYDLASIDQLNRFEKFRHVTLPPLQFTLYVFTCILTVLSLKTFDFIFTQTQGGPGGSSMVLTYVLYKISFINRNLGYGAAMSFYLLAIILGSTGILYWLWGRKVSR